MERTVRAALAAILSILLVAGGTLAVTQASDDDIAALQAAPWTLSSLDGGAIPAEAGITASFGEDGSLTGFAGCNQYGGSYTLEGDSVTVSPLAATRMACEQAVMDTEDLFLDLLENAVAWSISGGTLVIEAADGGTLGFGEETAEPAPFTGTEWALVDVSGAAVDAALGVTAVFADDLSVTGFAGCNAYSGPYDIDEGAIAIGPLAATRMACDQEVMDVENAFLDLMEQVSTLSISGNELTLSTVDFESLTFQAPGDTVTGTLTGVTWILEDLDGEVIFADEGLTVEFGEDGKVSGSGGCNQLFGDYAVDGSSIVVNGLATTRMSCEDDVMALESVYIEILADAREWDITDGFLTLVASDGATLTYTAEARTTPTPAPVRTPKPTRTSAPTPAIVDATGLVGPTWVLSEMAGAAIPSSLLTVTIVFDADGTLSGNGGCNDYTGSWFADGSSITISDVTADDGECDATKAGLETGFLQFLPFLDAYVVADGELTLSSTLAGVEVVFSAG